MSEKYEGDELATVPSYTATVWVERSGAAGGIRVEVEDGSPERAIEAASIGAGRALRELLGDVREVAPAPFGGAS